MSQPKTYSTTLIHAHITRHSTTHRSYHRSSASSNPLLLTPSLPVAIPHSTRPGERVLGKSTGECLLTADLLAADKAVDGNGDGAVDVAAVAILAQSHLREGLADSEDGFEVANLRTVACQ